jgi:CRP-like cAMP-binding protein
LAASQRGQRLLGMQDHLMVLGRQTANERVASFLLLLADRLCVEEDTPLDMPMRQQDIADYLGLTIETVCRTLRELKKARLIAVPNFQQIILRNAEAIGAIAEGDD